jgi:hypothetical protein
MAAKADMQKPRLVRGFCFAAASLGSDGKGAETNSASCKRGGRYLVDAG